MLNYEESIEVLNYFLVDCMEYWVMQDKDIPTAKELTIKDVMNIENNPMVPRGDKLDPKAKSDFIDGLSYY